MVVLAKKIQDSGWSFADLFSSFHDHRIFFPRLLYLAIAYLTGFNSVTQTMASFLMLSVIVFIITNYIVQRENVSNRKKYLFIAVSSFFIYNYMQWENLLWGFQVGFVMVLLFQILSIYFLHLMFGAANKKERCIRFAAAAFAALIASFSSIQGLLSWIVGIVLLLLCSERRQLLRYLIVWAILALTVWTVYFYDYMALNLYGLPLNSPGLSDSSHSPVRLLLYFLSLTGNVIFIKLFNCGTTIAGLYVMAVLLVTCILLRKDRKQINHFLFPAGLILNGLLTTASIAVGRYDRGFEPLVLPSRYTSFSIYIIIGILLIWIEFKGSENKTAIKRFANLFIVLLILSLPITMGKGFYQGIMKANESKRLAYMLETFEIHPPENLLYLIPETFKNPEKLLPYMDFLRNHQYHVFRNPAYGIPPALYQDSLGVTNNEILQIDTNTIIIIKDRIQINIPEIASAYRQKITHLYLDIDGTIYPLYYNSHSFPPFIQRLAAVDKQKNPRQNAIVNEILHDSAPEIHQVKIKALATDGSFYIIDVK
jgi:hypothetical protein